MLRASACKAPATCSTSRRMFQDETLLARRELLGLLMLDGMDAGRQSPSCSATRHASSAAHGGWPRADRQCGRLRAFVARSAP